VGLKRTAAAVLGALVVAVTVGATISGASSTATMLAGQGGVEILSGGIVTVAVPHLPTEFNPSTPAGSNAITQMVMEQVLPQVFVTGPDLQEHASLGLVTSAEVTGLKPQTVVYTLAKGARWSDGVPITAADFAYDWERVLSIGAALPASFPLAGYRDITSVTGAHSARLGTTVTVVFAKPYADWMALFANLVPAHIARRWGWIDAFAGPVPAHLVSGGPFEITKIVPGRELILSRNPSYAGKPAHLAHIVFKVMPPAATLQALGDGSVDLAELTPGPAVNSAVAGSADLEQTVSASATLWQLDFNVADPVTGKLDVRQAVAAAINRPEVVADSIGLLVADATTAANRIYADHQQGGLANDGAFMAPDDSGADQLLASAGYPLSAQGVATSASGAPLVVTLTGPEGNPTIVAAEAEIQAELLQAGIELKVRNVATSELLSSILPRGEYQLALTPYLESPFPSTMARLYTDPVGPTPIPAGGTTASLPTGGNGPIGTKKEPSAANAGVVTRDVLGYDDAVVDGLFAKAQAELNAETDASLYNQIDTHLWQDLPTLPLFQVPTTLVRQARVVNVSDTATLAGPMWNAQSWAIQVSPPPTTSTTTPGS
jgi:peptide/nickel transport system substrate-binding protein